MKNTLALLFFYLAFGATAQSSYSISGIISDEASKAIDLALISVFNQADTSFVKSEYSDTDGSFLINNLPEGNYILRFSAGGYEKLDRPISLTENLNLNVELISDGQEIEAVQVNAKIPFVQRKIDRTVVTPDALIANAGSNALEVLERAPGVTVDQNGVIAIKGRTGVNVYINDKPSYLSGSDLESYLRSLPSSSIKNIEIIENPPAHYEAAGNAGIININIKRNTLKGVFGNAAVSYRRSRYNGSNNSVNLNYNREKVSFSANLFGGFWQNFQDLNINRYYLDDNGALTSSFEQNSFSNRNGYYLNGKFGLDFYPTEKSTFGISYKGTTSPNDQKIDNTSIVQDNMGNLQQEVIADNLSQTTFRSNLFSGYFTRKIDTLGSQLSVDADYVQYVSSNDQLFYNYQFDNAGNLTYQDQINGAIPSQISIYAAKTDFEKPFKNNSKFDAGLKTAFTQTDNEAIYTTTIEGITSPDYSLSNRFLYDEWINAAYANYQIQAGKIGLQFGLRGEMTRLEGNQLGNALVSDTSFVRTYASLFPTFYASTKLDSAGNHGLNFTYGRRIDRPYFQDLNPFISPFDKFTFYTGNPNLLPTFSHNTSLTYSYKNLMNVSISYSITTDEIRETLEIQNGIYFSRPGNIASSQFVSLAVDGNVPLTKWYRLNGYMEVAYVQFDSPLYSQQLNSSGINAFISLTNSFILKNDWSFEVSGRWLNNQTASQLVIKGYAMLNAGVRKSIFDGRGSIRIAANDLFYSRIGSGVINNLEQTDADWNSTFDSRSVTATFSYRFGKSTNAKQKRNSSGSEGEQRRVRG
ncbi:MAG: outer membrane beta-barrel family protein [Crocinitomicaceae bacterium]